MEVVRPGTIGPHPEGAGTQWKMAADGFFASRCKAAGGGKKLAVAVAGRRSRRSRSSVRPNPLEDAVGVADKEIRRDTTMAIGLRRSDGDKHPAGFS
jgi:hypothetical protein